MGKVKVNDKELVAPAAEMTVKDLKDLADLPEHDKLYTPDGRMLDDTDVVPTEGARYGAVTDWDRG
jgi:hypothetical protein